MIEFFTPDRKDEGKFEDILKLGVLRSRVFFLDSEVDCELSRRFRRETIAMSGAKNGKDPITVIINSPGGEVTEGFAIISTIRQLQRQGVKVQALVQGDAASMAAVIAAACDTCEMTSLSRLMWHGITGGFMGDLSDLDANKREIENMAERLMEILTKRARNEDSKYHNPAFVKKILRDKKPVWIYPKDALEAGIVDEVVE